VAGEATSSLQKPGWHDDQRQYDRDLGEEPKARAKQQRYENNLLHRNRKIPG
jgi:hypothetical protein